MRKALLLRQSTLVLVYKESYLSSNDLDPSLPSSFVSLLQEFQDVFPDDIPSGLPPIRGIEHQIDFVPGSTIQNRSYIDVSLRKPRSYKGKLRTLLIKATLEKA